MLVIQSWQALPKSPCVKPALRHLAAGWVTLQGAAECDSGRMPGQATQMGADLSAPVDSTFNLLKDIRREVKVLDGVFP